LTPVISSLGLVSAILVEKGKTKAKKREKGLTNCQVRLAIRQKTGKYGLNTWIMRE